MSFIKSSALSVVRIAFPSLSFETSCNIMSFNKVDLDKVLSPLRMALKKVLMLCLMESVAVCADTELLTNVNARTVNNSDTFFMIVLFIEWLDIVN